MALYLKTQDLIDYFRALRTNRKINVSPYMDNALLNIQQLIEIDQYNTCISIMWKLEIVKNASGRTGPKNVLAVGETVT